MLVLVHKNDTPFSLVVPVVQEPSWIMKHKVWGPEKVYGSQVNFEMDYHKHVQL